MNYDEFVPDAALLPCKRLLYKVEDLAWDSDGEQTWELRRQGLGYRRLGLPVTPDEANLVSSLCEDGLHRPCLDIDAGPRVAEKLRLAFGRTTYLWVPSSNNWHVYLPHVALTSAQYLVVLGCLRATGALGYGNVAFAEVNDGTTTLRPPHIKKGDA